MAVYKSKSKAEASAFCRALVARGYRQVAPVHELVQPRLREFRLYVRRGWFVVSYQEPSVSGPLKKIPSAAPNVKPWALGGRREAMSKRCSCGCLRLAEVRGLSRPCYARFRYWSNDQIREKSVERSRSVRLSARSAQETVQEK